MDVIIRPLDQRDLPDADRIVRTAFGTFLGLPDPSAMFGDSDYVYTRFRASPADALAAEANGKLVGSNFLTQWGSFAYFGPLSVEPQLWDQDIARQLLEVTAERFEKWQCAHAGLFTFAHSAKHVALYQKFGFWAGHLTAVMSIKAGSAAADFNLFSELPPSEKEQIIATCRDLTDRIFSGLDVSREIRAVESQRLGDTVLLLDGSKLVAFAVCHAGPRTEAGSGACYIKFGAVWPGHAAPDAFCRLIDACSAFAASREMEKLTAGINMARHEAYAMMVGRGFRSDMIGVAMQKANDLGFNRPGVFVLDDWR